MFQIDGSHNLAISSFDFSDGFAPNIIPNFSTAVYITVM